MYQQLNQAQRYLLLAFSIFRDLSHWGTAGGMYGYLSLKRQYPLRQTYASTQMLLPNLHITCEC